MFRAAAAASVFLCLWCTAHAQVVSPFAGSEPVGEYRSEFVRLHYLVPDGDSIGSDTAEGRLISRIFRQPDGRSNFEVIRSFENALTAEGFEVIGVLENRNRVELAAREANGPNGNALGSRPYTLAGRSTGLSTKAQVATQAQEYIAARKTVGPTELLVIVSTSRSSHYLIEELEFAAIERGTVVLTLDALRDGLAADGRVALYGIRFATGSAQIQPESAEALGIIVAYLRESSDGVFYVVGHTDDAGSLASNMALSESRAQSVVEAISAQLPSARDRLIPHGVGPLSPVATNGAEDGRALNRRVELVSTHE